MVESFRDEGVKGLLGGVPPWPVTAIVAQSYSVSQGDIRADSGRNRSCDLSHFESMSEASALMIGGMDDNLSFASQPSERRGMDDAIPVALKTGTFRIGFLGKATVAGTHSAGGSWAQQ